MRKLLLASVAVLGGTAGLVNIASAQVASQYQGITTASPPFAQVAPAGTPNLTAPSYGTPTPSYGTPMAPGSMSVRIVGRLVAYAGFAADSGRNGTVTSSAANTTAGSVSTGSPAANTKLAPYGMFEFARLYPSFDAVAANGLKYGAFLEIRQDQSSAPGGGANGSISGAARDRAGLYFRRETGYIGTDTLGFLRFGATDQPSSLMITGNFENFDDGGWNGDLNLLTSNTQLAWTGPDAGNLYTTTKIVYMSPQFFNLVDFGVSFEPNSGSLGGGSGNCPYGVTYSTGVNASGTSGNGYGCDEASSTSVAGELKRRRNTIDAVARVRAAMGPVGIAATIGTIQGGSVQYNGTSTTVQKYNGLHVIDAGLQLTYGGFAIGGHVDAGKTANNWSLEPKGGANAMGILAGTSYTIGPVVAGVQLLHSEHSGGWTQSMKSTVGRLMTENGVAVGSTLTIAPGAYLFLSYLYGHRHQAGYDILSGATSATAAVRTNNNVQSQMLQVGTMFRW